MGGGTAEFANGVPPRTLDLRGEGPRPALAIASDDTIYSAHSRLYNWSTWQSSLFRVRLGLPETSTGNRMVASKDGAEIHEFSSSGKHLRTLDALTGAVLYQFGYDPQGPLLSVTDASGAATSIERDAQGAPLAIKAPFGQRTVIESDATGQVLGLTSPAGERHQMRYTAGGLLTSFTTPIGATSTMAYAADGLLLRDSDAEGGFWEMLGSKTANGALVSLTSEMGRSSFFLTEDFATGVQRRTITGPTGASTVQSRGANGVFATTDPDGTVITTTRKPDPRFGLMSPMSDVSVKLPSGLTMTSTTNRSAALAHPGNPLSLAGLTTTTSINCRNYSSVYDGGLRQFTNTTPTGRVSKVSVDYLGRPVSLLADPTLVPFTMTYNAQGFLSKLSQGESSLSYGYDSLGRKSSATNALKETVSYGYDAADRVNRLTLPSGRTYLLGYNADGLMTSLTMPKGNVHQKDYTLLGMDKSYTPPENDPYSWSYNPDRDWTRSRFPSGRSMSAGYDTGGRPTGLVYPEATVDYIYASGDKTDRISSMVRTPTGGGTPQQITYSYDGRLVTQAATSGVTTGAVSYSYGYLFLPSAINLTSGSDSFNSEISRDGDGLITGFGPFTYTRSGPAGAVTAIRDWTFNLSFGYDDYGRLSEKSITVKSVPVFKANYRYDAVGRISNIKETISGVSSDYAYIYDADGQLLERRKNGAAFESYAYDPNGNRTRYTLSGEMSTSIETTYDAQDRIMRHGESPYRFDIDGFMVKGWHVDNCRYSTQGELLSAEAWSGPITYGYDGFGRRVARSDNSGIYQYFYANPESPFQLSAARSPSGVFTAYYYDPSGALFAFKRGASTYYVASDHLGSPRVVTDAEGTVVKTIHYDSYGQVLLESGPTYDLPVGFAGGIPDNTGLTRFGYRDYEPATGRWVSRDPILYWSGQANLYQYAQNDPVNLLDPEGLAPRDKHFGLPPEFWHWYHQNRKDPGDPDLPTRKAAKEFHDEWEKLGKPRPDHKGRHRVCKFDESAFTGLPDGIGTLMPLLLPSISSPGPSTTSVRFPIPRLVWF